MFVRVRAEVCALTQGSHGCVAFHDKGTEQVWLSKVPVVEILSGLLRWPGVSSGPNSKKRETRESQSGEGEWQRGWEGKETYCPRSLQKGGSHGTSAPQKRKSPASPHGSSALQKCTMLNVCCLKPLSVWQSIPTATVFNTNNTLTHFRYAKLDCLGFEAQAIFLSKLHPHCVSYGQCSRERIWSAVATG